MVKAECSCEQYPPTCALHGEPRYVPVAGPQLPAPAPSPEYEAAAEELNAVLIAAAQELDTRFRLPGYAELFCSQGNVVRLCWSRGWGFSIVTRALAGGPVVENRDLLVQPLGVRIKAVKALPALIRDLENRHEVELEELRNTVRYGYEILAGLRGTDG